MRRAVALVTLSLALWPTGPLGAQLKDVTDEMSPVEPRARAGIFGNYISPKGEFGEFVDQGFGLSGWVGLPIGPSGQVFVGLEGSFANYGTRTNTVPLSPTIPGLYVDVTTSSNIATIGIPLRIELTPGPIRPYVVGSVGLAYFWTETSARGTSSSGDFARSINFDDITAQWTAGGGIAIQVSKGLTPVSIDLGLRQVMNGEVEYLTEESVIDDGGPITVVPIRSEANFLVWQVGVKVGIR
jgi:hypothetical protein